MTTRRTFFQSLAVVPLALLGVKVGPRIFHLPVGCDLSMVSLNYALDEGHRMGYGFPRKLVIGPENRFAARELLGTPCTDSSEVNWIHYFPYEETRDIPMWTWRIEFEHGTVESRGPR